MSKKVIEALQKSLKEMGTVEIVVDGNKAFINVLAVDEMEGFGFEGGILSFYFVSSPESDA